MSQSDLTPNKGDVNLWLAYAEALKPLLAPAGLGANGAVYIPPLSSGGITGGPPRVPQAVQNLGIYDVADNMLDPDTPVFMPGGNSYFKQLDLFTAYVQLNTNSGQAAAQRLEDAQRNLEKAQTYYKDINKEAHAEYKRAQVEHEIAPEMTFDQYVNGGNYPSYKTAWYNRQAAAQKVDAELSVTSGENWKQFQALRSGLESAQATTLIPGYNMPAADASALDIAARAMPANGQYFVPAYRIQDTYTNAVADWKQRWDDPSFAANAKKISFSASDDTKNKWSDLGFSEDTVKVSGNYSVFFSATFTENNQQITKHISASEAANALTITITARGYDVFTINPGAWDVPDVSAYKLKSNAPASLRKGMVKVQSVLMGYGISMDISMDSSLSEEVHDLLEKSRSTAGTVSFFGYNVGLGGSGESETTSSINFDDLTVDKLGGLISIPPQDNTYPTLLAVLGRKQETTLTE